MSWNKQCCCLQERLSTVSEQQDDLWVNADISDGAAPTITNNGVESASISVTGGTGANGNGRVYTISWINAHPLGANYHSNIEVWNDTQPDTGIPEILSKTATSMIYQITQGDDGSSPDDNDFYRHHVKISGTNQTFLTQVLLDGVAI